MFNRKSQSLLEFMTTWGWVILIIVIVIGLLFSFGVFTSPTITAPVINGFSGVTVSNGAANSSLMVLQFHNDENKPVYIDNVSTNLNGNVYSSFQCAQQTVAPGSSTFCRVKISNDQSSYTASVSVKYNITNLNFYSYSNGTISSQTVSNLEPINNQITYFNETGLVPGSVWNVTFDGIKKSTTGNNISFDIPFGEYNYSVAVGNFTGCNNSISVDSGTAQTGYSIVLPFKSSCKITFIESGLPTGINWTVTLVQPGCIVLGKIHCLERATYDKTNSSKGTTITFVLPYGSYAYLDSAYANSTYDFIERYSSNSTSGSIVAGISKYLSFSPDNSVVYVYAANPSMNIVSVINATSNAVIKNITVGTYPQYLTLSTNGQFVFVQNQKANTTSIINTTSNTLLNTINDYGTGTSENHSTGVTYFLNASDGYPKGTVFVPGTPGIDDVGLINASNNDFVGERGPSSPTTGGVIIQQCLNVSNPPTNISCEGYVLSRFDAAYIGTGSYVPFTANGSGIALERWGSEANKIAYVSLPKQNMVVVLNVSSAPGSICSGGHCYTPNLIIANITSPSGSPTAWFNGVNAVQFNPNGRLAYVLNTGGAGIGVYVSVINVTTSKIITNVTLTTNSGAQGEDLAVTPDGNYAYISYYSTAGGDRISVINLNTYSTTLISGVASGAGTYFGIAAAARDESI